MMQSISSSSFLLVSVVAYILAWRSETPPNLDEPRVKIMPGFPRDGDLPKPLARTIPPFVVTLPILVQTVSYYNYHFQNGNSVAVEDIIFLEGFWQIGGFLMIVLSHILMQYVRSHCGRFYTFDRSIKKCHHLVTTGPYQYVQNPGYTSMIGTTLGIWMFTKGHWINIVPTIIISIVLSGIPIEERMLRDEFGKEYDEFQATRNRFFPGIF